MARFTDEELVAYADGELLPERAKAVADACATDPQVAARVRAFKESRDALRSAFARQVEEPVPHRLLEMFDEQPKVVALPRKSRPSWIPMALAAGVVLAIGWNVVMRWQPRNETPAQIVKVDDALLQQPLEHLASGEPQAIDGGAIMPVASFVGEQGQYCREYEATLAGQKQRGLACRDAQHRWTTLATAQSPTPATPSANDEFTPASGEGSALDVAIGAAKRLTPVEEQAAIRHGWEQK